jgi:hypothetical protein
MPPYRGARDDLYDSLRDLLYISTDTGETLRYHVDDVEFLAPIRLGVASFSGPTATAAGGR